ncbi:putative adenosine monophosphate-protein transferase Fic [Pseudomonas sp. XS1P51]
MDRYDAANDHYCYPGGGVLKNKLNIKDADKLELAERDITNKTIDLVSYQPPPYGLEYLQGIHSTLFSPLYEWAGSVRDVSIAKGGTVFCISSRVEPEAEKLFSRLAGDRWLSGLSKKEFCAALAEYYCEINMIHPFREGNGRVQRVLFEHLALFNGYELDWSDITSSEWVLANIDGVNVDYKKMEAVFSRILKLS